MGRTKRRLHFQTILSSVHVMNDSQNYPINDHVYCQHLHENAGYFSVDQVALVALGHNA